MEGRFGYMYLYVQHTFKERGFFFINISWHIVLIYVLIFPSAKIPEKKEIYLSQGNSLYSHTNTHWSPSIYSIFSIFLNLTFSIYESTINPQFIMEKLKKIIFILRVYICGKFYYCFDNKFVKYTRDWSCNK